MKMMVCVSSCELRSWGSVSGAVEDSRAAPAAMFLLEQAADKAWPNS